jgi:hypothetical protein
MGVRRAGIAIALMVAACGQEQPPPADTSSSPVGGAGMTLDRDLAAGEIPARFHGVWDTAGGDCNPVSITQVRITARRIEYHGAIGDVSGMGSDGEDVIADLVIGVGGQTRIEPTRLSFETTPEGERLRMSDALAPESPDDPLRQRCPA